MDIAVVGDRAGLDHRLALDLYQPNRAATEADMASTTATAEDRALEASARTIAAADRGAPAHNGDLPPGTTVRLLKSDGDKALIARDGQELGFAPATSLAPLN